MSTSGKAYLGCNCTCEDGCDWRTYCTTPLPCPNTSTAVCGGRGLVTGNLVVGCGFRASPRRHRHPLLSLAEGVLGNATGDLVVGCSCNCSTGYNASTNCLTPLSCALDSCSLHGVVLGNQVSGCNCSCDLGYDGSTRATVVLLGMKTSSSDARRRDREATPNARKANLRSHTRRK
jgi:hypothetical protein